MTLEELKFELGMLEDRKRRSTFPQVVMVCGYIGVAIIICLLIANAFPEDSAPEWLLLLLAPAAMALWFGIAKIVEHRSPPSDWTSQDEDRLRELKHSLFMRGGR